MEIISIMGFSSILRPLSASENDCTEYTPVENWAHGIHKKSSVL